MGPPEKAKTPSKPPKQSKAAKFSKRKVQLRAISTPNKNESFLQSNVTINAADISAIPVLTPPTTRKAKTTVNEASFQFRKKRGRTSDDMFDEIAVQKPKKAKSSQKTAEQPSPSTTRSGRTPRKNPKYK